MQRLLVTGATGFVGSHVAERAASNGWTVRALVRPGSRVDDLRSLGVELVTGTLDDPATLPDAVREVTHVVHCAAKVGDWGPVDDYRRTNVEGLRSLLKALSRSGTAPLFIHVSSLGVYPARDHYGTDESEPLDERGIDGYTRTKVEAESLLRRVGGELGVPFIVLRPGFIYGPRDRTVLPRLLERLRQKKVAYLGSGQQLLNQIFVGNLVDAIFLALGKPELRGQVFNLTDGRLVTRIEFLETICRLSRLEAPQRHVPLPVARTLAALLEGVYRLGGAREAPLLSQARIKFLGLNLDFSIDRAVRDLGYAPNVPFAEGMEQTIAWARQVGLVESSAVCENESSEKTAS